MLNLCYREAFIAPVTADDHIFNALRAGNRDEAITALVREHQGFIMSVALRHVRRREDALDVTHDVLVKVIEALPRYTQQASLRTWLYRITVNTCISLQRKQRWLQYFSVGESEGELDVRSGDPGPDHAVEHDEFYRYLDTVLRTLPAKQRETFCLRYFDELSYEEMSAILGTSVGALKANYHWAIKKLAEHLRTSEYYQLWHTTSKTTTQTTT